jgi:IS5 family transposase
MFREPLVDLLDQSKPLLQLGRDIQWAQFEANLKPLYAQTGRPSKPIRLMVGLLILKQLHNLSDEHVVLMWRENPNWQQFTGSVYFEDRVPCEASELTHFRNRIGPGGAELILAESVRVNGKSVTVEEIIVDTTCQEKNITYPTDEKLAAQAIAQCRKIAEVEGIELRQSYVRVEKKLRDTIRFTHRQPTIKRRALKKLRTVAGRLLRDVERKLPVSVFKQYQTRLNNCAKVISQQRTDRDKIYSLHEPHVVCIAKGKAHKPFEFGSKAAIGVCVLSGIIVGAASFADNRHDTKTQPKLLETVFRVSGKRPKLAVGDRGYRGTPDYMGTVTISPQPTRKTDLKSTSAKKNLRRLFRKRSGIEAVNSHLKNDYRLRRCYLKGIAGDEMNVSLACAAYNFRKWMMELPATCLGSFLGLFRRTKTALWLRFKYAQPARCRVLGAAFLRVD